MDYQKLQGLYSELNEMLNPENASDDLSASDATKMFYLTLEYNSLVEEFNKSSKNDAEVRTALAGMTKIKSSAVQILKY